MSTPLAVYTPYELGAQAARRRDTTNACPYLFNPTMRSSWLAGYKDRERELVSAERERRRVNALHERSAWFRQQAAVR
jgi:hypothetical protein